MSNKKYDTEAIRNYLLDRVPDEIKREIEASIFEDPDLAYEINVQKTLLSGIEAEFDQDLKSRLKAQDSTLNQKQFSWTLRVAASVSVGLIGYFLYISIFGFNAEKVFQENYVTYYNVMDDQRRGVNVESSESSPYLLYERQNYAMAIVELEKLLSNQSENDAAQFYCGLSYIETGDLSAAIVKLKKVASSKTQFEEPAQWYLGLTLLRNGDIDIATKIFKEIEQSSSAYAQQAKDVLNELD